MDSRLFQEFKNIKHRLMPSARLQHLFQIMPEMKQKNFAVLPAVRVMPGCHKLIENGGRIRKVEISGKEHRVFAAGTRADHGMARRKGAFAESAVTEVPEIKLTAERQAQRGNLVDLSGMFQPAFNLCPDPFKQIGKRQIAV